MAANSAMRLCEAVLLRYSTAIFSLFFVYGLSVLCAGRPTTCGTFVKPRDCASLMDASPTWTCPKLTMPPICLAAFAKVGAIWAHGAHPSAPNETTHASLPFSITRSFQLLSSRSITAASASSARAVCAEATHRRSAATSHGRAISMRLA